MFFVETMDVLSSFHFEPTLFERVMTALQKDKNNNLRSGGTKRCLFGKHDPEDTEELLKEQSEDDKRRLRERYGLDLEDVENRGGEDDGRKNRKAKRGGKGERKAFRPYNKQSKVTGGSRFNYYKLGRTINRNVGQEMEFLI